MKKLAISAVLVLLVSMAVDVSAQIPGTRIPPRVEDHFWRRRVINRIDLSEKINTPLVTPEQPDVYPIGQGPYTGRQGVVEALLHGLREGKYLAYNPDSLHKPMTYEEVVAKAKKYEEGGGSDDNTDNTEDGFEDFDATDETFENDEDMTADDLEGDTDPASGGGKAEGDFDVTPYETVLEFIEDRIFDKNRSDMVFDIQYIRLVWVDKAETLPDENFVCFKYSDIVSTLENTQWKNKYNDAEYRNMREIFELRLFHSFMTQISGDFSSIKSINQADYRRNQFTEFEHHLWCY